MWKLWLRQRLAVVKFCWTNELVGIFFFAFLLCWLTVLVD